MSAYLDVQMGDMTVMSKGEGLEKLEHESLDILKIRNIVKNILK